MRILLAAIACTALVVYGEEPKSKTDAYRQKAAQAIQQTASATDGKVIVVNQQTPEGQENNHPQKPPSYLSRLFTPENIPNIALVIVAIGGIIVAVYTLRGINRQAGLMDGQLHEMKQAREIETKTLLLQYRPRVIVRDARVYDFNVARLGEMAKGKVKFSIINTGGSPAHIVGGTIALWAIESPGSAHSKKVTIHEGTESELWEFTLQPGEQSAWEETLDAAVTNDIQWANYHEGIATDPLKSIYLVGTIWYRDDLNIPRRTGINRRYDPTTTWFKAVDSEGEYND